MGKWLGAGYNSYMETVWQYFGFFGVLLLIVLIVRYFYSESISEYGKVLEEMPNDYSDFDEKTLHQYIEMTTVKIEAIDERIQRATWLKRRKLYVLKRKLEDIRFELLQFEKSNSPKK